MSKVLRYNISYEVLQNKDGFWVHWTDFEALKKDFLSVLISLPEDRGRSLMEKWFP